MIKLKSLLPKSVLSELVRLNSIKEVEAIRLELAYAAQKIYDEWVQDEEGYDHEVGNGGICHLIADELIDVLYEHNINRCETTSSTSEQHVYITGQFREGIYMIDVPYSIYETGGAYNWKKRPDIKFAAEHIDIYRLDTNPRRLRQYTDNM